VPLAEWSGEAAVENQQDIRLPFEIGKPDRLTLKIFQSEIWSRTVQSDSWHNISFIVLL
jgi:hypothetical protein